MPVTDGAVVVVVAADVDIPNWLAVLAAVVVLVVGGICAVAKPFGNAVVGGELGCNVCAALPGAGDAVLTVAGGVLAGIDLTKPLCVD